MSPRAPTALTVPARPLGPPPTGPGPRTAFQPPGAVSAYPSDTAVVPVAISPQPCRPTSRPSLGPCPYPGRWPVPGNGAARLLAGWWDGWWLWQPGPAPMAPGSPSSAPARGQKSKSGVNYCVCHMEQTYPAHNRALTHCCLESLQQLQPRTKAIISVI